MGNGLKAKSWSFLRPVWPALTELIVLSMFINLMALAVPVFVLQVYDRVVAKGGLTTLQGLAIGMAAVILMDFLFRQTRNRVVQRASLRYDLYFGDTLFNKINRLPLGVLESKPAAFWQGVFRDSETVRNAVAGAPAILLIDLPFAVLFLGVIYLIAPPLMFVMMVAAAVFLLFAIMSGFAVNRVAQAERGELLSRDGFLADLVANRTTIKALALEKAVAPIWAEKHTAAIEGAMARGRVGDTYGNIGFSLTMLTTISITTAGALAIMDQQISIGSLVATNMLASRIVGPFSQLVGQWRNVVMARQAARRVRQVLQMVDEYRPQAIEMPRPDGALALDNVEFSFDRNQDPLITELNLKVPATGLHAIVGPNGSGKTTMLKLMQGLYRPDKGRVLLDGADLMQFTPEELSRWVGYVPQENVLIAGTIKENLARGREEISDDDIIAAAKTSGAHEFIVDLPDGYGTVVGEGGRALSGGQRQRIAIARALIGNPPVLLLDEPSASLDRQMEERLARLLQELAVDHTVIVVTHSPIMLSACRDVVVLERGKIRQGGATRDVLPNLFRRAQQPQQQPATVAPVPAKQPDNSDQASETPEKEVS